MKTSELFEAKQVLPSWARQEELAFRLLLSKYGLTCRKKPIFYKDKWYFGGEIVDTDKGGITLSLEKRVAGAARAVAKHLFDLKEEGREVNTLSPERYGYKTISGWVHYTITDFTPRHIYADDSLAAIEKLVAERLFVNNRSRGGYTLIFQYAVSEPKKEEPKTTEKKVFRVVKGVK